MLARFHVSTYSYAVLILVVVTLYFVVSLVTGSRGIVALRDLISEMKVQQHQLDGLLEKKGVLENRVRLLQEESLDLDLLDERVRFILGYAEARELVLLRSSNHGD